MIKIRTKIIAILIALVILLMMIGIFHEINGPRLAEGYVIGKQIRPPINNEKYPNFILIVELNNVKDTWYVSEKYYDSVHIGSYVKR